VTNNILISLTFIFPVENVNSNAQGRSLRAIRDEMRARGFQISHEGVARMADGLTILKGGFGRLFARPRLAIARRQRPCEQNTVARSTFTRHF
jgi:hypothetical protein